MSYFIVKSRKSADMKAALLLVRRVSGRPWSANSLRRACMVTRDNMVDTRTTSSHLEWESMIIKKHLALE